MAIKNSRRISSNKRKEIKLNLGCGGKLLEGYINCDPYVDAIGIEKVDIRKLPYERDSIDYILLDNVLEHLPMADIPLALYEIRRVLKTGGRCVIAVPEFTCLAKMWLEMESTKFFNPLIWKWVSETIYGTQLHQGEYHRTPISRHYLNYVLQMVGFTNYTMDLYPMGTEMPSEERFPGINPNNEKNAMRNDNIYVDIIK